MRVYVFYYLQLYIKSCCMATISVLSVNVYSNGRKYTREYQLTHHALMYINQKVLCASHFSKLKALLAISTPLKGNLSKPRRQRQRERRQTKGLMRRTIAVHVRYKSLYISSPFSAKQQREMTKFRVFWRTWATTANILDFPIELIAGITYLV